MNKNIVILLSLFIVLTIVGRFYPAVYNFSPIIGLSLFGAAFLPQKKYAFLIPLLLIYFTDFVINNTIFRSFYPNHEGLVFFSNYMIWMVISYALIVGIGLLTLKKPNFIKVAGAALSGSFLFFIITNFGVWMAGGYGKTWSGLIICYEMAIPFYRNALVGDLLSTALLFGGYFALEKWTNQSSQTATATQSF
jgi:hypothetical protein